MFPGGVWRRERERGVERVKDGGLGEAAHVISHETWALSIKSSII